MDSKLTLLLLYTYDKETELFFRNIPLNLKKINIHLQVCF